MLLILTFSDLPKFHSVFQTFIIVYLLSMTVFDLSIYVYFFHQEYVKINELIINNF